MGKEELELGYKFRLTDEVL